MENTALQNHQSSLKFNVLKERKICMVKNKGKTRNLPKTVDIRGSKDMVVLSQGKGKGLFIVGRRGEK